jgi:hypothetical protein
VNVFTVFFPPVMAGTTFAWLFIGAFIIYKGMHLKPLLSTKQTVFLFTTYLYIFGILAAASYFVIFQTSGNWMRAVPTPDWERELQGTDTAIILGFGYEKGKNGEVLAGEANDFLWKWTVDHTAAKTIFVQEGVWAAAANQQEARYQAAGRQIKRIYQYDPTVNIHTLETVYYVLGEMKALGKKKTVIIGHDLQLARIQADFIKVTKAEKEWPDYTFIVPEIPPTPYPIHSVQRQTCSAARYKIWEICSRVRDYLSDIPAD